MNNLLRDPRVPFIVICAVSLGLIGGGVVMAQVLHLAACPLCIIQRMLYLLLGATAGIGIAVAARASARRFVALLSAALAGTGVFVAGYQVWIQRFARDTNCAANAPWWERMVDWAGEQVPLLFQSNGLCSDPAWKFLGLSIAEWSLIAFSALAVVAIVQILRRYAGD